MLCILAFSVGGSLVIGPLVGWLTCSLFLSCRLELEGFPLVEKIERNKYQSSKRYVGKSMVVEGNMQGESFKVGSFMKYVSMSKGLPLHPCFSFEGGGFL